MKDVLAQAKSDRTLKQIFDLFCRPYIKTMHPRTRKSPVQLIEDFFHVETRKLINAVVVKSFGLPGGKRAAENKIVYGLPRLKLPEGTIVTIRMDKTTPNAIDIGFEIGDDEYEYVLSQIEFQYVIPKLKSLEDL